MVPPPRSLVCMSHLQLDLSSSSLAALFLPAIHRHAMSSLVNSALSQAGIVRPANGDPRGVVGSVVGSSTRMEIEGAEHGSAARRGGRGNGAGRGRKGGRAGGQGDHQVCSLGLWFGSSCVET